MHQFNIRVCIKLHGSSLGDGAISVCLNDYYCLDQLQYLVSCLNIMSVDWIDMYSMVSGEDGMWQFDGYEYSLYLQDMGL